MKNFTLIVLFAFLGTFISKAQPYYSFEALTEPYVELTTGDMVDTSVSQNIGFLCRAPLYCVWQRTKQYLHGRNQWFSG